MLTGHVGEGLVRHGDHVLYMLSVELGEHAASWGYLAETRRYVGIDLGGCQIGTSCRRDGR
jgi:hypothetical protein